MISAPQIRKLFEELDRRLGEEGETGEIGIVGGAVMCLVYRARESTRDVDAVFAPPGIIRRIAQEIGHRAGIGRDWLNDAAKAYVQGEFGRQAVLDLQHLRVWAPEGRYMLAMKCLSARWDSHDREDVIFLIRHLRLETAESVFKIVEGYFPRHHIPPKTRYFVEEVFEELESSANKAPDGDNSGGKVRAARKR